MTWFIVTGRADAVAWQSRGSVGASLGPTSGAQKGWALYARGFGKVIAWPRTSGTGGTTAVGGNGPQWKAYARPGAVFAWRQRPINNTVTPPTPTPGIGGGYDEKKRKRYFYEKDGRIVVTTDPSRAIPVAEAASPVPVAPTVAEVKEIAAKYEKAEEVQRALTDADFQRAYEIYEALWMQQDEEDIEALLATIH